MNDAKQTAHDVVFLAQQNSGDEDGWTTIGVFKTLEGAKLACGDADRYAADDEDGDDKLAWHSHEDQLWNAEGESGLSFAIEANRLLA